MRPLPNKLPEELLNSPLIWRAGDRPRLATAGIASGFAELDRELPDNGWPRAALTELLCDAVGIGEVSLLLPAMANAQVRGKGIIWIAPPYLPYAPALAAAGVDLRKLLIVHPANGVDTLWAAEQAMRAGAAAMAVAWLNPNVEYAMLRRLQLACSSAECAGFIYRASNAARQASPAVLRLLATQSLSAERGSLTLRILKRRGMHAAQPLSLATSATSTSLRPFCVDRNCTRTMRRVDRIKVG
jgi:protein ImuA